MAQKRPYLITFYQTDGGKWKWKMSQRQHVLAVSARGYNKKHQCVRAIKGIVQKITGLDPNYEIGLRIIKQDHDIAFNFESSKGIF